MSLIHENSLLQDLTFIKNEREYRQWLHATAFTSLPRYDYEPECATRRKDTRDRWRPPSYPCWLMSVCDSCGRLDSEREVKCLLVDDLRHMLEGLK